MSQKSIYNENEDCGCNEITDCGCDGGENSIYGGGANTNNIYDDEIIFIKQDIEKNKSNNDSNIQDAIIISNPEIEQSTPQGGGNFVAIGSGLDTNLFYAQSQQNTSQKIQINGIVVDGFGDILEAAHVYEVGNEAYGTITDSNGQFQLLVNRNSQVAISFVGFVTAVYTAENVPTTVALITETLDEVIIDIPKKTNLASLGYLAGGLLVLLALGKLFGGEETTKKTVKAIL